MFRRRSIVVTCEHASSRTPAALSDLFHDRQGVLRSHRGWDPGALDLARTLGRRLGTRPIAATVSRLVVDANRTRGNRDVVSRYTRELPTAARERLLVRYWDPHRGRVVAAMERAMASAPVVHLGVHSFTPRLRGVVRRLDIGLLYDPSRPEERRVARLIREEIGRRAPRLRVRFNQPYRGTSDGLTTDLRRGYPDPDYAGLELEVSQRLVRAGEDRWGATCDLLAEALAAALARL